MRNLETVRKVQSSYSLRDPCTSIFCRGENSSLYVIEKGSEVTRLIRCSVEGLSALELLCQGEEVLQDVFQMQFVPTTGFLFMATDDGAFLQTSDTSCAQLQELFRSDEGISQFSVSPDGRLVAILTKQRTLLLLTLPDLESIGQHALESLTQVSQPIEVDSCLINAVSIAWRWDSRYFAVNFPVIKGTEKSWQMKVYDEDCALFSTTEECNPLINRSLEWQPSGGLLATYGKSPHGDVIVLFELNGLKRADFSPFDGRKVEEKEDVFDIMWNSASDVLAIRLKTSVELWTRSNYVWMRKKSLVSYSDTKKQGIAYAEWDSELPYRIHVVFEDGGYFAYDVNFTYTSGITNGSALTVSWNGRNVYCTPFRDNCAPPPYGYLQASVDADILTVLVSSFWDGLVCVTTDRKFIFMKNEKNELLTVKTCSCREDPFMRSAECWVWSSRSTLCCIYNGGIATLTVNCLEPSNVEAKLEKHDFIGFDVILGDPGIAKQKQFCRIFPLNGSDESNLIVAETLSNSLVLINLITHAKTELCVLPHKCSNILAVKFSDENDVIVFAHDPLSKKLFAGWSKFSKCEPLKVSVDCTSFATFCENLLLTTSQGSLEILSKDCLIQTLEEGFNNQEVDQIKLAERKFSRKVEKGSLIVSCCLNQMLEPALVLQIIPRGNIETIHPRPLIVSTIRVVLREKENQSRYQKIMIALRRHRLDYRVLIEEMKTLGREDSEMPLETSLKLMVDQVQDSHSLVLLVTDLDEDHVDCIRIIKNLLEKVVLNRKDEKVRSPNIEEAYLASLAKLGLLEEALESSLIAGEDKDNRNFVTHRVKFLSYYCDNPDILFDTAIGTYDLTLASLVADCLGKDPKEYVPILDGFQSLPERKRMFKIDDRLRRYSKAVISLIKDQCVQHDEILKYMERHRLFTDVLDFFKKSSKTQINDTDRTQEDVSLLINESKTSYGKYLEEHGKLKEACILYSGGGQCTKAIDCAVKSGCWETALEIAYEQNFNQNQLADVCERILENLEENKNYSGAARVSEIHLNDAQRAVSFWLRDRKWLTAKALARKNPELGQKFIEETICPSLIQAAYEKSEYLGSLENELIQKLTRLREVKAAKARRLADFGDDGMGDVFSDTDSVSTGSVKSGSISTGSGTGKTFRTGKSRRKLERKLYSMKEGSRYEDLGITAHLWSLFEKIQHEIKPDTSLVIESLWNFELNDLALSLGLVFDKLLTESNRAIQEIWSVVLNDELLELKYRVPPVGWSTSWDKLCLHEPSSKAGRHQGC